MDCDQFKTNIEPAAVEVEVVKKPLVLPYSVWQNKKTRNYYLVEAVLPDFTNSREGEFVVIYHQTTDVTCRGVRELEEFYIKFNEVQDNHRSRQT